MTKLDPEKLAVLADDLREVERKNEEVLSHEKPIAESLAKVRRTVQQKYDEVSD